MTSIEEMKPKEILSVMMNFPLEVKLDIFSKLAQWIPILDVIAFIEDQYPSMIVSHFMVRDIINLELYPAKIIDEVLILRSLKNGKLYKMEFKTKITAEIVNYEE